MKSSTAKQLASLVALLQKAKDRRELSCLLEDLLTPQEIATFAERVEIFRLLDSGMAQRDIVNKVGCGIATITRGSKEMRHGHGIVPKLLKRV